jgi:hypothetical protein
MTTEDTASANWTRVTDALDVLQRPGAFDGLTAQQLGRVFGRAQAIARQAADRESAVNEAAAGGLKGGREGGWKGWPEDSPAQED